MSANYNTPGVYIEEIAKFPPSVVAVETAIPAFIGYTEQTRYRGENLVGKAVAIRSRLDFETIFGLSPAIGSFTVGIDADGAVISTVDNPNNGTGARFRLAASINHYFRNGGGRCYIIAIGDYTASATTSDIVAAHIAGLTTLAREDEPTLIVMPDLGTMTPAPPGDDNAIASVRASYHSVLIAALKQCGELGDRFLVSDLWDGDQSGEDGIAALRDGIGTSDLKYGAIYHPFLQTTLPWRWDETSITVSQLASRNDDGSLTRPGTYDAMTLVALRDDATRANPTIYGNVRAALDRFTVTLPPAPAVTGVYCTVDRTRGVWKAPANESLTAVRAATVAIDDTLNATMNVDATGKSINAIRFFSGRGHMVWGARTLAGNSNEWRYVSVRRFFNMVEESTRKATMPFVFEPNDARTWSKVRAMIENFLVLQWRAGALAGAKPEQAFYVRCGLGTTMTAQDILEGRMHVEIGMAVVRPAEFIILRFSHKMQEA